ncbi:hypothetical protein AAFF_G00273760 [Aldrovandia affinis]|uniref:Uncharacterized protein n=1 Tax=Aldrovandia affinis TaxID=143900 RepID=A0AAD7WTA3_9TELE|nr:hypothetical protein AAFF_G00273760 [Aldrovandia affinis]
MNRSSKLQARWALRPDKAFTQRPSSVSPVRSLRLCECQPGSRVWALAVGERPDEYAPLGQRHHPPTLGSRCPSVDASRKEPRRKEIQRFLRRFDLPFPNPRRLSQSPS